MEASGALPAMQALGRVMRITNMPINDPRLQTLTRGQAELMYWIDLMSDPKKLKAYKSNKSRIVDEDFEEELNRTSEEATTKTTKPDDWEAV